MKSSSTAKNILLCLAAAIGVFLFFKYILSLFLPFILAFVIAFFLNYPIKLLHKRTHIPKGILSAFLITLLTALLGFCIFLLVNRIVSELGDLLKSLGENAGRYVSEFFTLLDSFAEKLPFINAIGADLSETVTEVVKDMLTTITSKIPPIIADIIAMLPHILLFTVVIILSSYYFCADFENIKQWLFSLLPTSVGNSLLNLKRRITNTGLKYLKACAVMLVITYFELMVGFLMIDIPYAFSLSLLVAAVDMLPIFGVGTVLVPWAIWCKLTGDTYTAVGLIIIFATVTVVRRFIEPKIISTEIGLSPLTTLLAMYIGFRLFGLTGLFFSPLVAILVLHALPENISSKLGFTDSASK